jgi:hypothetical protein
MEVQKISIKGERGEASEPDQNAAFPDLYFCPQTPVVNLRKLSTSNF